MPELPEVETIARDLQKLICHKQIKQVEVFDPLVVKQTKKSFIHSLKGQQVHKVYRRGKAIIVALGDCFLVIQPMMTGQAVVDGKSDKHTRVRIDFSDGHHLLYNDQRRFGHVRAVRALEEINYFNILGPEPLTPDFHTDYLLQALKKTARPIKNVLLDHTVVSGIGNIYACEILFRAKLSPMRAAQGISKREAGLIYRHTVEILNEAIAARGSSMRNYRDAKGQEGGFNKLVRVYGRQGLACDSCGKPIAREVQSARSTFYCVKCQQ